VAWDAGYRFTRLRTPRTHGVVERFNGRIADVPRTHHFNGREYLAHTLLRMRRCTTTNCLSRR
jgi:hypothetical protein